VDAGTGAERIRGPTSSLAVRKGYSVTRLAQTLWTRLSHSSTACARRAMGNGNGGEQVSETKRFIFGPPKPSKSPPRSLFRRYSSGLSPGNSDHREDHFSRFQSSHPSLSVRNTRRGRACHTGLSLLVALSSSQPPSYLTSGAARSGEG